MTFLAEAAATSSLPFDASRKPIHSNSQLSLVAFLPVILVRLIKIRHWSGGSSLAVRASLIRTGLESPHGVLHFCSLRLATCSSNIGVNRTRSLLDVTTYRFHQKTSGQQRGGKCHWLAEGKHLGYGHVVTSAADGLTMYDVTY